MIAVVALVVAGDRSTMTGEFNRHSVFATALECYSRIKKCLAEQRRELVRGNAFSRYEQFENGLGSKPPVEMLFSDDLVLGETSIKEVGQELEKCRYPFERCTSRQ